MSRYRGLRFRTSASPPAGSTGSSPLARNEHPRLILSTDNLAAVRAKLADTSTTTGWNNEFKTYVQTYVNPLLSTTVDSNNNQRRRNAVALAFVHATYGSSGIAGVTYAGANPNSTYGDMARQYLLALSTAAPDFNQTFPPGPMVACAFDWCFDRLSAGDKSTMLGYFKQIDTIGKFTPHNPFDSEIVIPKAYRLMHGLAVSGMNVDDSEAWSSGCLAEWNSYWRGSSGHPIMESFLGGDHGESGQGDSYQYYSWLAAWPAEEAYRTANAIASSAHYGSSHARYLTNWAHKETYRLLPYAPAASSAFFPGGKRWRQWRTGSIESFFDANQSNHNQILVTLSRSLVNAAAPARAQLAAWLEENRIQQDSLSATTMDYWAMRFIAADRSVVAASPTALGLPVSLLADSGRCVFRQDWTSTNGAYVTFTAAPWFAKAEADPVWDQGAYTVHRRGPMLDRRAQAGQGGALFFLPHNSRNNLMFPDRSASSAVAADTYGGVRTGFAGGLSAPSGSTDYVSGTGFEALGPNGVRFRAASGTRDVDYVMADMTRSYDWLSFHPSNPHRVNNAERHFAYFRNSTLTDSVRLLIYDRYSITSSAYMPTVSINPPGVDVVVDGTPVTGVPVRNGSTHGHVTYTNASQATWDVNQNGWAGSARVNFLYPTAANRTVIRAGGPSQASTAQWRSNSTGSSHSYEYVDLYGEPLDVDSGVTHGDEYDLHGGWYHLQMTPSNPSTSGSLLHAVEVGDLSFTPSSVEMHDGNNFIAGRMGNRIGVFPKSSVTQSSGSFQILTSGTYNVLIAGLSTAGVAATITGDGSIASIVGIDPSGSSPFTPSTAGTVYLTIRAASSGAVVTVA